jgi:hypothetical protein
MFRNNRRKEKKAAQAQAAREKQARFENDIEEKIDSVSQIEDAAARVKSLSEIQDALISKIARDTTTFYMNRTMNPEKIQAFLKTPHMKEIFSKSDRVAQLITDEIENNLTAIAQSPLYGEVSRIKGITERFADAAARHLVAEAEKVEAENMAAHSPKPDESAQAPQQSQERADYTRIASTGLS